MNQEYPVTRLQAAKWLRQRQRLEKEFKRDLTIHVLIMWRNGLEKTIACRMWSGPGVWWTQLSWKQLLSFIRRNYPRSYTSLDHVA